MKLLAFALLLTLPADSQTATITPPPTGFASIIPLWPAGQVPLAAGTGEGHTPRLYAYPAPGPGPHPVVIVMPGGGYTHLAIEKEGAAPARWLNAHGVSAFVLEYRLSPAYHFPAPMLDAARAIRYLRANASTLAIDPHKLGVWGFSAGAHLSGYLASVHDQGQSQPADPVDRQPDRPDFAILSYGRFDLSPDTPRGTPTDAAPSMETVLAATTSQIDVLPLITADNSPSFLYSTTGDQTVDSRNSTLFYNELKRVKVPAELHVFELGAHGSGLADNANKTPTPAPPELAIWPTLLAHWMQQNSWMPTP